MIANWPEQHIAVLGIQAISRYGIASKVGMNEEVTFAELAERCNLPVEDLRRILRLSMAKHIFKEPRKGYVAHNAASRVFVESEGLNNWTHVALDEIWPSAAHLLDAMDKWKGSEEANETVSGLPRRPRKKNKLRHKCAFFRGSILRKVQETLSSRAWKITHNEETHLPMS